MTTQYGFPYRPVDSEAEKASNSYLMSMIAVVAGLPLPIVNLIASVIFYAANRKGTYFVRWHCTQMLVSQLVFLVANSAGFWWTIAIIFNAAPIDNNYIGYILTLLIFNLFEFIGTIYAAIQTRKGIHVRWWFFADLTDSICKP